MALPSIFETTVTSGLIERLKQISPDAKPIWGKMNAGQMLAHCNVTYEYVFEPEKYKPTPAFLKFIFRFLIKNKIVSETPFKQGSPTGPDFVITNDRDFEKEKNRLITFIEETQKAGAVFFEGKESHSFGKLTAIEWNNMFYKHVDHHLRQFGV